MLNRRIQTENALGDLSSVIYDAVSNVVATVDARGNRTTSTYDALNRAESWTDALDQTTTAIYDKVGNVVEQIDALGNRTTSTYDGLNRLVTTEASDGGVSSTVYDAASNVVATVDPLGNRTSFSYDALNRQSEIEDAENGVTTFLFDSVGNRTVVIDSVGNRTTSVFDALNREIEQIEATFVRVSPALNLHVGGQVLRTTVEHPFWVKDIGWVPAGSLKSGDLLSTYEGEWVPVEGIDDKGEVETVYNLRVADYHTYFVTCGEIGWSLWAHNADRYVVLPVDGVWVLVDTSKKGGRLVPDADGIPR